MAGESQATSNAQMPSTAPLFPPQRPNSRSVTQAFPHSRRPGEPASAAKTAPTRLQGSPQEGLVGAATSHRSEDGRQAQASEGMEAGLALQGGGESMELQSQLAAVGPQPAAQGTPAGRSLQSMMRIVC